MLYKCFIWISEDLPGADESAVGTINRPLQLTGFTCQFAYPAPMDDPLVHLQVFVTFPICDVGLQTSKFAALDRRKDLHKLIAQHAPE